VLLFAEALFLVSFWQLVVSAQIFFKISFESLRRSIRASFIWQACFLFSAPFSLFTSTSLQPFPSQLFPALSKL
jgi:hypothetical protein